MQPEVAMKTETYEVQIGKLLEQLTLEEKIGMIHGAGLFRTEGVERLSIPPLFFSDGPMGVRAEFVSAASFTIFVICGTTEEIIQPSISVFLIW